MQDVRCEQVAELPDGRLSSASAERNKGPILAVLERVLPESGLVLEIASGTGQHVIHFAGKLDRLIWQPSDPGAECRRSVAAWLSAARLRNVRAPIDLDVHALPWPGAAPDAVVCINLLHIAPWTAVEALFHGTAHSLRDSGLLYLYGPYFQRDKPTAPGNAAFDRELRAKNPAWGLRELEDVLRLATDTGFEHVETVEMPANNLSVLLRRRRASVPETPLGGW